MKKLSFIVFIGVLFFLQGCGYTTRSLLPARFRTIYVEPFKNNVNYTTGNSRNLYYPLMEVKVRNGIIDRFLFDGSLKIAKEEAADLILKGELLSYDKEALRYTDNDDVEEYRIRIVVNLVLWDVEREEAFFEESSFAGETTYFVSGSLAKSEATAVEDAVVDLARRVVERTIENW